MQKMNRKGQGLTLALIILGCLLVGGGTLLYGNGHGWFSSASAGAPSYVPTQVAASSMFDKIIDMRVSGGTFNNDTSSDYYSNSDHNLAQYLNDADADDTSDDINFTLTLDRANTQEAATVYVDCVFNTKFTSAGTNYNLLDVDTDVTEDIKGLYDGSAATCVGQKMTFPVSFSAGDPQTAVVVTVDQLEAGQDAMSEMSELNAVCKIQDQTNTIRLIANS